MVSGFKRKRKKKRRRKTQRVVVKWKKIQESEIKKKAVPFFRVCGSWTETESAREKKREKKERDRGREREREWDSEKFLTRPILISTL